MATSDEMPMLQPGALSSCPGACVAPSTPAAASGHPSGRERALALLRADIGMSFGAIARECGLTKGVVAGIAFRAGLTQPGRNQIPRPQPTARPAAPRAARAAVVLPAIPAATVARAPSPAPVALAAYVPAPRTAGRGCRWPSGDPRAPGFRWCDAPPVPGRPYCWDHCCAAYQGFAQPAPGWAHQLGLPGSPETPACLSAGGVSSLDCAAGASASAAAFSGGVGA